MKLEISTHHKLKVRQATQLLNAITLLDDALAMTDEWAEGLLTKLNDAIPGRSLGDELRQLGKDVLDPIQSISLKSVDSVLMSVVIQEQVSTCSSDEDIELASLTEGSIRGQFRKKLKKAAEKLRAMLASMKSLLPDANADAFKSHLALALASKDVGPEALELAAGLGVLSAASMSNVLTEVEANKLEVTSDDDDTQLVPAMA